MSDITEIVKDLDRLKYAEKSRYRNDPDTKR